MQITHQADYATRAILHLARTQKDTFVPTNEIANRQNIPSSFLTKIIAQLSIAGLLHTSRGAHGGVKLARQPENITLLQVIEAIDGPIRFNMCVENGIDCDCTLEKNSPLRSTWWDVQQELVTKLRNTNFEQLKNNHILKGKNHHHELHNEPDQ
jgi:Rrf2 family protein